MSCSTDTCGVGGWGGPKPGDPDNNSILTATPAFGGIDVAWTLPTTNPHAVAFTTLYRGILSDFNSAIQIAQVAGDQYYDKSQTPQLIQYYYWIRFTSINGTVGELIGPASAVARPTIDVVLEQLAGRIDAGALSQALKADIDRSQLNFAALQEEIANRTAANAAYGTALEQVQAGMEQVIGLINQEIAIRQEGESALASQVNTVALVSQNNLAAVQTTLQTNITSVGNTVSQIGALYTAKVTVNGLIGGFGIYNDGTEVQAGFDVDTFWIGRTSADKVKPFIIENGVVYMSSAVIKDGTIGIAKIADSIQSTNYSSGLAGWKLTKAGTLELNGTRMQITNSVISVRDDAGVERVRIGTL
ncbi:MAG: hypothetical protein E6R03_16820 [Hyphomicrobiaceae bacterium]|nr:MAG: hypothetical protein E6R03_16820 [Hyphomicrobiaceae bacterium]